MNIHSAGKRFILVSALLLALLAGVFIGSTDIGAWYFQMAVDYPDWIATAIPGLVLLALAMAFLRSSRNRPS